MPDSWSAFYNATTAAEAAEREASLLPAAVPALARGRRHSLQAVGPAAGAGSAGSLASATHPCVSALFVISCLLNAGLFLYGNLAVAATVWTTVVLIPGGEGTRSKVGSPPCAADA